MSIIENIYKLCDERGISAWQLGNELGFSNGYLNMVRRRGNAPTAERVQMIADYFGVSVETLSGKENRSPLLINILGKVSAGVPLDAIENIIGQEEIKPELAEKGEHFGLKIKGDSMIPEIKDGDIVVVRIQPDAESGDIVVAYVGNYDGVCKKLKKYGDEIQLLSINPEYEPYSSKEYPIEIIGKVIEIRREL